MVSIFCGAVSIGATEKYIGSMLDCAVVNLINYKSQNALPSMFHVRIHQKNCIN